MSYDTHMLLALVNLCLCAGIFAVCVQRIGVMTKHTTRLVWRAHYAVLMTCSALSGFSPVVFHEWPGFATIIMTTAFLAILLTSRQWKDGVPWYARKNRFDRRSPK